MTKFKYLAFAIAMAAAAPAFSASSTGEVGGTLTSNATKLTADFTASSSNYTIKLIWAGISSTSTDYLGSFGALIKNTSNQTVASFFQGASGNESQLTSVTYKLTNLVAGANYKLVAFASSFDPSDTFNVTGFYAGASATPVSVPGPEAGTGLAALAMAGVGALAYRRKQKLAA